MNCQLLTVSFNCRWVIERQSGIVCGCVSDKGFESFSSYFCRRDVRAARSPEQSRSHRTPETMNRAQSLTFVLSLWSALAHGQQKFTLSTSGVFSNDIATTETSPVTKVPVQVLVCPSPLRIPIFSLPCNHEKDCRVFGPGLACCQERCVKGVLVPQTSKLTAGARKTRISNEIEDSLVKPTKNTPPVLLTTSTVKSTTVKLTNVGSTSVKLSGNGKLVCPGGDVRVPIFSLPCAKKADCDVFGTGMLCCQNRCLKAVFQPQPEVKHQPALFGLVDRLCPAQPLAEIFDVRQCVSDGDCNPRICCPEKNGKSYCRTPVHNVDRLPGGKQIEKPLRNFASYLQCTPPPPAVLDLFPRACTSALDCFPNLCCQENDKKFCRPPKRSLLSLLADVTSRIGASELTRRFIQRITT